MILSKLPTQEVDKSQFSFSVTNNPYFDNTIASYMVKAVHKESKRSFTVMGGNGFIVGSDMLTRIPNAIPKRFYRTVAKSYIDELPEALVVYTGELHAKD